MFITFKLSKALKLMAAIVLILLLILILCRTEKAPALAADDREYTLVLDAGHGGIDGGAVSASGQKESDINLSIACRTRLLADFFGVRTVMTRETDTDGSENGHYSEHDNLMKRAEITNSTENAVLISIHQNVYPSERVRGAEVMYAATAGSEELALTLQHNLVERLDPENRRVAIPAPEKLLLTSSVNCPAVLVECGFVSNPEEAEQLAKTDYQLKIAEIFIASYLQFAKSNGV